MIMSVLTQQFAKQTQEKHEYEKYERFLPKAKKYPQRVFFMIMSVLTQQFAKQTQEKHEYEKYERFFMLCMKKISLGEKISSLTMPFCKRQRRRQSSTKNFYSNIPTV